MLNLPRFNNSSSVYYLLFLIVLIAFYAFFDFLVFRKLYLFKDIGSDSITSVLPLWLNISDYLRTEGIPKWSFNQGMGQYIFPFKLSNPFNLILYALGRDLLAYGIIYVELIKIILGGLFFYAYLRTLSLTYFASIIGGLSFSFSGFMIVGGQWYLFSVEAVYMAFLLLSFEQLLLRQNWVLFPIAVALIGAFLPFDLYLFGVFLLFYSMFRFLEQYGLRRKGAVIFLIKLTILSLVGVSISSVFLVPNLIELIESQRAAEDSFRLLGFSPEYIFRTEGALHNLTALMRLFSNDLLGTGSDFHGWRNYLEAPLFYVGLIYLLLAPQLFVFLDKKKKALYGILILITLVPVIFPFFRHAAWAFFDDNYRLFSLFISFVVMLMGLRALSHIEKEHRINLLLMVSTGFFLLAAIWTPLFILKGQIDSNLVTIITIFITLYAVILVLMKTENCRPKIYSALLLFICLEYGYFVSLSVEGRLVITTKEYLQRVGYNDHTVDALRYLRSADQGLYRIEKSYQSSPTKHSGLNDSLAQGFNGTSSYYSFNQPYYVRFFAEMNLLDSSHRDRTRWVPGLGSRVSLMTFASVKYILAKQTDRHRVPISTFEQIGEFGDVVLYENKHFLPFGYTYDRYITYEKFHALTDKQKEITLLNAFVAYTNYAELGKDFSLYHPESGVRPYNLNSYVDDVNNRKKEYLELSSHGQSRIEGTIKLKADKLLFFSIPYDPGWTAKVNGKSADILRINIGFMGLNLEQGHHTVELQYEPRYFKASVMMSVVSMLLFLVFVWRRASNTKFMGSRLIDFLQEPTGG